MRRGFPLAMLVLVSLPASGSAERVGSYSQCVALVQRNPSLGEESARVWLNEGGGAAAMHCSALALTALQRYGEAARELDVVARNRAITNNLDRGDLFDQAGNAWMLAGSAGNAVRSFSNALSQNANDIGYLVDRARAYAMMKDWSGANNDLSAALVKDQNRADLLVLRASARWALGRKADAATDIVRALQLYPDYPAALVERGMMKFSVDDKEGARADWKKAASQPGGGAAVEEARRNLAALGPESKPGR
ncbi:MAG: hypothetical protein KGJ79_10785 [Alphaproteobacteria bacterium]|nr:hypothetical protein [Alphaproteobacteria bacterium]MDE2111617.1 hypothetical protein [Alphaproteobacteria bacterium]MDE2494336.1 hypothetical protein [Alphaproteobacteria bacterium]